MRAQPEPSPEYHQLARTWRQAAQVVERSGGSTDAQDRREQDSWQALVDYVDDNKLTYSILDPRGEDHLAWQERK